MLMAFQNESLRDGLSPGVITVSVDEKPGVQAIANVAPDLPPKPGRHPCVARDYEYKRLGTCSILAALDLHSGGNGAGGALKTNTLRRSSPAEPAPSRSRL